MLYLITQELPEQCIVLSVFGKRQAKSREGALLLIELWREWRATCWVSGGALVCLQWALTIVVGPAHLVRRRDAGGRLDIRLLSLGS